MAAMVLGNIGFDESSGRVNSAAWSRTRALRGIEAIDGALSILFANAQPANQIFIDRRQYENFKAIHENRATRRAKRKQKGR